MNGIIPFDFEGHAVRVVMQGDDPWFVAADVCRALELTNSRKFIAPLDDDEKGVAKINTLGGKQTLNIISEGGLHTLTIRSRLALTPGTVQHRFRKWVTSDLLPSLRKHGSYALPSAEDAVLQERRDWAASQKEVHRQTGADRARVIARIETLLDEGLSTAKAVEQVAAETGLSASTIWRHRSKVWMVPRRDWEAALVPRWGGGGPVRIAKQCHPEALAYFKHLAGLGVRFSECWRRLQEEAARNDWRPIPRTSTMRRVHKVVNGLPDPVTGKLLAGVM